ncbi:MAG: 1-acyl-sn-glycerol-3-phosphate acyltransferase [Muribaculaceae bacterium]|nr:1-acyl-sn-glycerol-3-phosphate acyltransferase [Muribaculaceae bacterium]
MKSIVLRLYQFLIAAPILLVLTILAAVLTSIGSLLGGGRFWGYWPAHLWARAFCVLCLVRVTVEGRENISPKTSYVFVANHQGAFDIFSIYGYLNHDFRWMMKKGLERIPLVGYSCKVSGHIYVDSSTPAATRHTMAEAEKRLRDGMSVVVFPEGSRTRDGRMHRFHRGAYMLAMEFSLPVVPITIDGAYDVMPRGSQLPKPGHIKLTIHKPIEPGTEGHDLNDLMAETYSAIASALPGEASAQTGGYQN